MRDVPTKHVGTAAVMADAANIRRATLLKEIENRREQLKMPLDLEIPCFEVIVFSGGILTFWELTVCPHMFKSVI